ncbi:MAG TPA: ABA4-like family protein [Chloroflexota bacterium]|jgi:hypothetical protein|nr:ABA4-like family protein [Chloroflexota bacterium]
MAEALFSLSNVLIMPFWLLMIFASNWRWTRRIVASPLIAVPPAVIYAVVIVPQLAAVFPALMRPQLATIAAVLGTPWGATAAWAHLVAFDLFVGRWIYLDSRSRDASPWTVGPILFLTLMVGPLGLLLYLLVRPVWRAGDPPRA